MKMTGQFAVIATITLCSSASAAVVLWGKVEVGMTRAQVQALYPVGGEVSFRDGKVHLNNVAVTDRCNADADITFDRQDVVDEVRLSGGASIGGRCAERVLVVLSSKYGQPATTKEKGGGLLARGGKTYIWSRPEGVTLRFKDYEGGALAAKSWELRYSAAPMSTAL